eukprot:PRCOL_00003947-RA
MASAAAARSAGAAPLALRPLREVGGGGEAERRGALREAAANAAPFVAVAELPLPLPADSRVALRALRALRLEERIPGAPRGAIDDVYEDALEVARVWAEAVEDARARGDECGDGGIDACVVQVKLLTETMCPRLHVDHVAARAMCTIIGRGTEYVDDPGVLSKAASFTVASGGNALGDALKGAVERVATFREAREREVVLIKGTAWPGARRQDAILHRSPQVDGDGGEFRLVVKVDEGIATVSTATAAPRVREHEPAA